jgi:biofilm PGA synthesis protein PgaD
MKQEDLIINRPDWVTRGQQVTAVGTTLFFWFALLYLWQPLISLIAWAFNVKLFYSHMVVLGGYETFLDVWKAYALVIVLMGGSLIVWARINQWRFRGAERRTAIPRTDDGDVAETFQMTVTGEVVDAGPFATGPDGCPNPADACFFDPSGNNGIYNFLPAYSVIGVWSTTPDVINFITPAGGTSWIDALIPVGSGGLFDVPQGYSSAYLFLAENDGFYTDNDPIGEYEVTISLVPVPATAWLLGLAVFCLGFVRRNRGQTTV